MNRWLLIFVLLDLLSSRHQITTIFFNSKEYKYTSGNEEIMHLYFYKIHDFL